MGAGDGLHECYPRAASPPGKWSGCNLPLRVTGTPSSAGASVPRRGPGALERVLRERLDALGPPPRAELLHVLTLPDFERAGMIGGYYGNPKTRTFAELLIDCKESPTTRAVLVGMLREAD
jgi:hypothetical protein